MDSHPVSLVKLYARIYAYQALLVVIKWGQRIGRTIVDKYGDKVMAAQLPGET